MGNKTLTFAIPPGQLKFSRPMTAMLPLADAKPVESEPLADKTEPVNAITDTKSDEDEAPVGGKTYTNGPKTRTQELEKLDEAGSLGRVAQPVDGVMDTTRLERYDVPVEGKTDGNEPNANTQAQGKPDDDVPLADEVQPVKVVMDTRTKEDEAFAGHKTDGSGPETGTLEQHTTLGILGFGEETALSSGYRNDKTPPADTNDTGNGPSVSSSEPPEPSEAVIHHEIKNLAQLMSKAIEIDGRLDPKDIKAVPAASPWKFMRVKRNNQDLGTLFEMRDEFYAYKLPKLAKTRKR